MAKTKNRIRELRATRNELKSQLRRVELLLAEAELEESRKLTRRIARTPKLYWAKSVVYNFPGRGDVTLYWYVSHRHRPPVPYERVIVDYRPKAQQTKMYPEEEIDQSFTKSEIEELRDYLSRVHGLDLVVGEMALPLRDIGPGCTTDKNDYRLSDEKDYNLSVPISAFVEPLVESPSADCEAEG